MLVRSAEESYANGLNALSNHQHREALAFFEASIELEKKFGVQVPQARYLSHYGLCLALMRRQLHEAIDLCRLGCRLDEFDADMHVNLAHVLMISDRRREAYRTVARGLRTHPENSVLRKFLRKLGLRRRPVLPFLDRANPLNVMLGRLRAGSPKQLARTA